MTKNSKFNPNLNPKFNNNVVKNKDLDRLLQEAKHINIKELVNTKLFSKKKLHVVKKNKTKKTKKTKKTNKNKK